MERWYVTGTDTGVGKTRVTACLARSARRDGRRVLALKPVASGTDGGPGEDALAIALAAGHAPQVHAALRAPVSPHRAAAAEGRTVSLDEVANFVASRTADVVLVEGAGGWRVPLGGPPWWALADLVRAAPGRVLVVAADRLGTLNHTLLTVEAIRRDGLGPAGVVLDAGVGPPDPQQADRSRATNLMDLRLMLDCPVVAIPAHDPGSAAEERIGEALWAAITSWMP